MQKLVRIISFPSAILKVLKKKVCKNNSHTQKKMENEQPLTEEQREGQDMEDNTPVLEDKELNKRFAEHSKKYAPNVTRLREAGLNDDEILDELYVIKDKEISLGKILGEVKFEFSSKKGDIKKGIYKLFEYIMLKYP